MATSKEINDLLEHIAFSFIHGDFDPASETGGCSCNTCQILREKIRTIHEKELQKYLADRGMIK